MKDIKIFLKKKKKKKEQNGREGYKNLSEAEKQRFAGYKKNIIEREKLLYYKKVFQFGRICFSLRESILKKYNFFLLCLCLKTTQNTEITKNYKIN